MLSVGCCRPSPPSSGGIPMRTAHWFCTLLFLVPLALAGCQQGPTDRQPTAETAKEYDVKGKVVDVAADRQAVTLDHEDIPGLMKGMTMKFRVADPKVLEGIQAGDAVGGRLKVQAGTYTITQLAKR